jgi:undecaprenyl phosphate-alpha-L-ara4N flippase subunit ArnE
MTTEIITLIAISIVCDVSGQIAFKLGADRLPAVETVGLAAFCRGMLGEPWLVGGIVVYIIEFIVWIRVLALVPLGIAFPIASLNILGIALASHFLLREAITRKQWLGAILITAGVAIVAQSI